MLGSACARISRNSHKSVINNHKSVINNHKSVINNHKSVINNHKSATNSSILVHSTSDTYLYMI